MSPVYHYRLRRDANDRIIEKTETVQGKARKWTYAYDHEGRLHEAHLDGRMICQCHYDKQARRSQDFFPFREGHKFLDYSYTLDDRLRSAGNNGYLHDESGNRKMWNKAGEYTHYRYSKDLRLLEVKEDSTRKRYTFSHDADGRRAVKRLNGRVVEQYAWLDFVRLAGYHDGRHGYRFAYNKGARVPFGMERDDGMAFELHYDQVGSLRVVADRRGNVIKEILYDPFGGIIEDTNPGFRIPIGFSGGLHDRDLGFVRFGWRDYDTFYRPLHRSGPTGRQGR